jgi:hypothetical protein
MRPATCCMMGRPPDVKQAKLTSCCGMQERKVLMVLIIARLSGADRGLNGDPLLRRCRGETGPSCPHLSMSIGVGEGRL